MSDWPCGLSTGCYYRTPILEALPRVRDGGFTLIEVCSFPAHLDYHNRGQVEAAAAAIRDLGIVANSMHAPFADHIDISSGDRPQRENSVRELCLASDAAAALGCRYLVLHPGPEMAGRPTPENWYWRMQNAAESLNHVADRCRDLGIILLLENMLPHLLFGHASDMLWLLGAIRGTGVGTCLDTGHAALSGDMPTVVHKLSGHLQMLHVNDNLGQYDDHLPPGDGHIDWLSLICQLNRQRFQGPLILELAGVGTPDEIMERARRARDFLADLSRRAAVEC